MVPPAAAVATSGGAMVDLSQSCTGIAQSQMRYFTLHLHQGMYHPNGSMRTAGMGA